MTNELHGHLAMLLFSALVAGSFALGGLIANLIDPMALTAMRFLFGALFMGALVAVSGQLRWAQFKAPWRYLVLGACMALYFVTMFVGLQTATPVSTAAIFTLTPLMSACFGWILLRQRLSRRIAAALLIGAIGAIWVIFRADLGAFLSFELGAGEAIFFVGCIGHALYTPLVPKLNRGEPTLAFTAGMLAAGALLLCLLGAPRILATDWLGLPASVYGVIAYLTFVTTGLTFYLVQFAAMRLPASKVMAYTYLTPSFVILWQGVLGNDFPAASVAFGALLTALALVMLLRRT